MIARDRISFCFPLVIFILTQNANQILAFLLIFGSEIAIILVKNVI